VERGDSIDELTHTHTRTHAHTHNYMHTHTYSHNTHTHTHTLSLSLSLSLTHTHTTTHITHTHRAPYMIHRQVEYVSQMRLSLEEEDEEVLRGMRGRGSAGYVLTAQHEEELYHPPRNSNEVATAARSPAALQRLR